LLFAKPLFFYKMPIKIITAFLLAFVGFLPATVNCTAQNSKQEKTINIGFLIQNNKKTAAKDAAELAISEANKAGTLEGEKFKLISYSVEGLWGTGSKKSVNLVFDDNVPAIIGSLDGRNAHLAEQVTAKTKVAFLSAHATDMTLSSAFVPWYFRCVPNDLQQAQVLLDEIYVKRKFKNITIIGTEDYDSEQAVLTFKKAANLLNDCELQQFIYRLSEDNSKEIITKIKNSETEAIVLSGTPESAASIVSLLQKENLNRPVFTTLSVLDNQKPETQNLQIFNGVIAVSSNRWITKAGATFQQKFIEEFGYQPGPAAAYAYDAIKLVIKTIRKTGADRDKIISVLQKTNYTGVTGKFGFDKNGNRTDKPVLVKIKNGVATSLF
jgi:branched-chain amino acid transport system substrate-binding protein